MRIFLTGATGYIGGAVAAALLERGHEVAALVRPESEARQLRERGALIVAGDLGSLSDLGSALAGYEAFVHTAFSSANTVELDRKAIEVFSAQKGFVVFTSGVWVLGYTGERQADETSPVDPISVVAWRPEHERRVLQRGHSAVIRPGCVYGGMGGMFAEWFAAADRRQPIDIVGMGTNRWAMVNLHDLAACYVRTVEERAVGIFHAVDDTRATLNECAQAVAPGGKVEHVPAELAREKMGPFADALLIDQHVSSEATRRRLGWMPRRTFPSAVDELWREWRAASSAA
ncbi:MAG TPA: NAD(P)H-binding protein [Thermoanaerobaculia bacterium]|nr:NAD(P)H-binding protein [Thermoanaerobaculia bacterium]